MSRSYEQHLLEERARAAAQAPQKTQMVIKTAEDPDAPPKRNWHDSPEGREEDAWVEESARLMCWE